jgi:hypothetical protein
MHSAGERIEDFIIERIGFKVYTIQLPVVLAMVSVLDPAGVIGLHSNSHTTSKSTIF